MDNSQQMEVLRLGAPEQLSRQRLEIVGAAKIKVLRSTENITEEPVQETGHSLAAEVIAKAEGILTNAAVLAEAEGILETGRQRIESQRQTTQANAFVVEAQAEIEAAYKAAPAGNPLFEDK